MMLV
jgi:hypothetical protein